MYRFIGIKVSPRIYILIQAFRLVAIYDLLSKFPAMVEAETVEELADTQQATWADQESVPALAECEKKKESEAEGEGEKQAQPATPSEAASETTKGVEAFSWDQLRQPKVEYCSHCKAAVTNSKPTQVVRKKGHKGVACRVCHNVVSLLYKRCDMKAVGWKSLSADQQTEFFQAAGKMTTNGALDFGKIKGKLIDTLTEVETHRQVTAMRGKYLPLSVWKSRGYDADVIENKAESKPSDLFLALTLSLLFLCFHCRNDLISNYTTVSLNTCFFIKHLYESVTKANYEQ